MSSGSTASSIHAPMRKSSQSTRSASYNRSDSLFSSSSSSVISQQPHRTLFQQTKGSKPPTSGPSKSYSPLTRSSSESKSMPGELSNFFGNVKRSFSGKKNDTSTSSHTPYYGITPEEDAARVQGYQPQRPLLPPPTFQQIASGIAVTNTRRAKRSSPLPPAPPRSSLKRTPTEESTTVVLTHSKLFSASSPSLALSTKSSPKKGHDATFLHAAPTGSSSSASSFTNSTTSSSFARLPFKKKHKLGLSISTITGLRGLNGSSGTTSPTDSSLSLGMVSASSVSDGRLSRKAVRFSESSHDRQPTMMGHTANVMPQSTLGGTPHHEIEAVPRHPTNGSKLVGRTARFFGR
ncbi:hypothetical protein FRC03_000690 [Tulasnella sp. 419]|nr:hypothetical protein FRC03_000690 [Tulasnella sp. 419]